MAHPSEVEQLLLRLGRELGRDAAQMRPIVEHVVQGCWYDSLASLRGIQSEEDWATLKLPPRLLTLVKRDLQSLTLGSAEAESLEQRQTAFLHTFDWAQVGETLDVLRRVLSNLHAHPDEDKYRRLNKQKTQTTALINNKTAIEILTLLNFKETGDILWARESPSADFVKQLLDKLPAFNPFAAAFTAAPGAVTVPHAKAAAERERQLQAMQQQQQQATETQPAPSVRVTTVAETLGNFRNDSAAQQTATGDTNDEELIMQAWRAMKQNSERTFASREKTELLRRKKEIVHSSCSLRIVFPDQVVLELNHYFLPKHTVQHVVEELQRKFLLDNSTVAFQFSLFLPPKRLDPRLTCEDAGLVPSATLRFNVEQPRGFRGPFLKPQT